MICNSVVWGTKINVMVMKLDEVTFICLGIDLYRKRAWILRKKKDSRKKEE
jgi:hypothetical protein